MRHVYIRGMLSVIWLIAAIACGIAGSFEMMILYLVMCGLFLHSAYVTWKKEKDKIGGR